MGTPLLEVIFCPEMVTRLVEVVGRTEKQPVGVPETAVFDSSVVPSSIFLHTQGPGRLS